MWYLRVEDLCNYIDKKITRQELNHKIEKNSDYYNSFRNYMSDNEIRNNIDKDIKSYKENSKDIIGIGVVTKVLSQSELK